MGRSGNKRIGILGGTFNPVHNGHLHLARAARRKLKLDRVVFVPARIPPHKRICGNATARDRLRMLRLALRGKKRFEISAFELKQNRKSYSVKTARFFKKRYGKGAELFFLIGADSLASLKEWKNITGIRKILRFVVIPRSAHGIKAAASDAIVLDIPKKDISSTEIRRLAKKKKPIGHLVPAAVRMYIILRKLYM